jgi:hypothetical protein
MEMIMVDVNLAMLIGEFKRARRVENERLFQAFGGAFISSHNPRITDDVNRSRIETRLKKLKAWCASWWHARGYTVEWGEPAEGSISEFHVELKK